MTPVVVVLAADDRFARPLATTVHSIIDTLSADRTLELYLFDVGITAEHRRAIESVAQRQGVVAHWISSVDGAVKDLPESWPGITRASYGRLLIPEILPDTATKAVYLDCDLIVRRCVGHLFDTPMDSYATLAVADAASPYVSSRYGVPHWARSGRRPDDVNFNAGVLLMDLDRWRAEDLADAALTYLTDGRHRFMQDQEAINAVSGDCTGLLDPRWNQQTEHFEPSFSAALPYDDSVLRQVINEPWIVHYTTSVKAWSYESSHPFREEWFTHLAGTPFAGWHQTRADYLRRRSAAVVSGVRRRVKAKVAT